MRRQFIFLLAVAAFTLLAGGGCKRSPHLEAPPKPSPPTNVAEENLGQQASNQIQKVPLPKGDLLKMKWPIGSRYVYRLDMEQHTTNQAPGSPQPNTEDLVLGVTYALTVVEETSNGGRELEMEFLANDMEIKIAGQVVINFDSVQSLTNEAAHPIPPPFRRMIGSKALLRTQPDGTVEKVLGLDAWVKSVAGDASGPAGQMIVQQFNENFFRQAADFGKGLPTKPVNPGDNWTFQTELPAGALGTIRLDSTITLTGWKEQEQHRFAILDAKGTLTSLPAQPPADGQLSLERGTVQSRAWFDPELGALTESVVEQSLRVKGPPPATAGGKPTEESFSNDLSQKVTVKMVELTKSQDPELPKTLGGPSAPK
jgi:Family of unknown function (DUF6263)